MSLPEWIPPCVFVIVAFLIPAGQARFEQRPRRRRRSRRTDVRIVAGDTNTPRWSTIVSTDRCLNARQAAYVKAQLATIPDGAPAMLAANAEAYAFEAAQAQTIKALAGPDPDTPYVDYQTPDDVADLRNDPDGIDHPLGDCDRCRHPAALLRGHCWSCHEATLLRVHLSTHGHHAPRIAPNGRMPDHLRAPDVFGLTPKDPW